MAYASTNVRADGVESSEFPHLAVKYQVAGVPRTVINEIHPPRRRRAARHDAGENPGGARRRTAKQLDEPARCHTT